ncbi:MAG TPA: DNA-directed RNA polymerase subunit beta' [Candidatus Paceibacterota bacterium]|nr:DNA-directed RNA polymerase subunit beta' [Candidatus Paceibacterota bacterium]
MKTIDTNNFDFMTLKLASPERIKAWSYGEVTKPETINYRTGRSERGGLFDERVFGPEKDYECYCGKYRRIRYKDIVCEKCGVEVTQSIVRRERMGHIELASPVAHIWFLRGVPSRMALLLGVSVTDLEKVVYFAGYIITKVFESEKKEIEKMLENEYKNKVKSAVDEDTKERLKDLLLSAKKELNEIQVGKVLNESAYHHVSLRYGTAFEASIGGEAIYNIFKGMDLEREKENTQKALETAGSAEREKLERRLGLLRSMIYSKIRPEWMFMTVIPVIPPALRPMVALDGNRHATSDVNDLYRRVINRNNRLKKLKEIGAPDVILRNEKRIMQEAVDALIDNSISAGGDAPAMSQSQRRALKSLADNLKSKQGLFRANLLGKRVDYSGRSVIVVGPQLKLSQCGLPKHMALELFRPFVVSKILERDLAFSKHIRAANKLIEEGTPEVWAILEEVIIGKRVLLNRAPTLHRLGIQAFQPVLIEGNAIQLHPLVCPAFNADFDGDQMAVHVPLSVEAQKEARELMSANKNLFKPQNGDPIVLPRMEMVAGVFWLTKEMAGEKGEGKYYASPNLAILSYEYGDVSLQAKIKVIGTDKKKYEKFEGKIFETTVGRLLFNSILPTDFSFVNEQMTSKRLSALVDEIIFHYGIDETPQILDKIKEFGFKYSTFSGISWGIDNVKVPEQKVAIVKDSRGKEKEIISQYDEGLLSEKEKYQKIIEIWEIAKKEIEKYIPETLDPRGSTYDLIISGARATMGSLVQMAGMKGLIQDTQGRIIPFPVIPSYTEGLSPIEYFITTHGSRKGLADTALNTARAGYLTRRLVNVAQDVTVTELDCKTKNGKTMRGENLSGIEISLAKNIRGRVLLADVKDKEGNVIFKKGHLVSKDDSEIIQKSGVEEVQVRTPLTCESLHGVCQACYGMDLGRNHIAALGEAVGIVAAQAIGEPGTQLTLRTFHSGGVAGVDITAGLPRIEEIFDARTIKNAAVIAHEDGIVQEVIDTQKEKKIIILANPRGAKKASVEEYEVPMTRKIIVSRGQNITQGMLMTDGSASLQELFKYAGMEETEEYIIREIRKVYELQSASIARKHIEVIIRQMFSRVKIVEAGDTMFPVGEVVEKVEFIDENNRIKAEGGREAKGGPVLLGITQVSLTSASWLSSASFQNTNRMLIDNAVRGGVERLRGLNENVIVGRLIPAGTGFKKGVK